MNKYLLHRFNLIILIWLFSITSSKAQDDDAYLQYVHPTINTPFPDVLNLGVPTELEDQALAGKGFLDVTRAPFNADPTGQEDCTDAIQAAITFARDHQLVCFFPEGTYLISNTLSCIQQFYRRANGKVFGGNRFPNVLWGSHAGKEKPKLVLAPNSPGFNDPNNLKIFIDFWARGYANPTNNYQAGIGCEDEQPNISMNQVLRNLEIVIGEGNAGAIAVHHQAAEGSSIEDCIIDATYGHTAIKGGIGSGGSSTGNKIIGGRIGLDYTGLFNGTQPTPVITGFTFEGQTRRVIKSTSRQTLVAVGIKIVANKSAGPLIEIPAGLGANLGQISLIDSEIQFSGEALAETERILIHSNRGAYLQNVYVYGSTKIVVDESLANELEGNPAGWLHVEQYAVESQNVLDRGNYYRYPVYLDNQSISEIIKINPDSVPPAKLQSGHFWSEDFPHFQKDGVINVKEAPYNVYGDGVHDDTEALQQAINENEIIFLPRGIYLISSTLELKPGTKLFGAGQTLTILISSPEDMFSNSDSPNPMIRTANSKEENYLAFFGIHILNTAPGCQFLHWRSGEESILREVEFKGVSKAEVPALFSGNAGGKIYNYRGHKWQTNNPLIENTFNELNFYQFSVQFLTSTVKNSSNVNFYGLKHEGNKPKLVISGSDSISIFGFGGNAKGAKDGSLFIIEDCTNFLFANCVDGSVKINDRNNTDPNLWNFLINKRHNGEVFRLPVMERPVLYMLGDLDNSISDEVWSGYLKTYPNPANESVFVDLPEINVIQKQISMYDLSGRMILSENLKETEGSIHELRLDKIDEGIYLLVLRSSKNIYIGKLIKN